MWALGLIVLTAACGPGKPSDSGDETGASTTLVDSTTTGVPDPTTTTVGESSTSSTSSTSTSTPTSGSNDECGTACDDSSTGSVFIPIDDFPVDGCDNFQQDCPEGTKCAAWADDGGSSWNALKCVPVIEDPKQPGEPCTAEPGLTGVDDCDVGVMCWDLDAESMGTCVPLCTGSLDTPVCDEPAAICVVTNSGVLNLCLPGCDPILQDCPMDELCIPNPDNSGFLCVLAPTEQGQQHDPCNFASGCDQGLLCADNTAASECNENRPGCCQPFCDFTDPDVMCSGDGQECIPFFEMGDAPDGLEHVGFCSLPP